MQHRQDFLKFEGNAQTLRVLARLQVVADDLGLNLTAGTLAALMKYVAPSDGCDDSRPARKKVGFFASEAAVVRIIREITGLEGDARHPLALVMEACDDIAYSVLDAEDAIKKGFVSFNDLIAWLRRAEDHDELIKCICEYASWQHNVFATQKLHPNELDDVSTQMFRVKAIHWMIASVVEVFVNNFDAITRGEFAGDLIAGSRAAKLCAELKRFDRENAFAHRSVLEIELHGFNIINRLMDYLWIGITQRRCYEEPASPRVTPFARYVYSRISRNYRRVFEGDLQTYGQFESLPLRYREMQLLTDMISGMTDQFCIDLLRDLETHHVEMREIDG
jgi:dGTPase